MKRVQRNRRAAEVPEIRRAAAAYGFHGPTSDGNWTTCCPFCLERVGREDREFKLTIKISGETTPSPKNPERIELSPDFGVWNCYRCHARGFADFRWMESGEAPVDFDAPRPEAAPVDLGPPEGFADLAACASSMTMRWAPAYFAGRGVLDQAIAVGAGACGTGRYQGRVVVPHRAFVGEGGNGPWLGFSARLVAEDPPERSKLSRGDRGEIVEERRRRPKYLYPRGMDRRTALWGLPWAPQDGSALYVVEGVFDALPLWPRALATFGKSVSEEQLDSLARIGRARPVVPCLDGDAWEESQALARMLARRGAVGGRWCKLPPESDPGTLGWLVKDYERQLGA